MDTSDLAQKIQTARSSGFNDDQIKNYLQTNGVASSDIDTALTPTPSLTQRVGSDFSSRVNDAADAQVSAEQGKQSPISAGLQTLGQGAGFVGDIGLEGLKSADNAVTGGKVGDVLAAALSKVGHTEAAQYLLAKYKEFSDQHPEASANLGALVNIASIVPEGEAADAAAQAAGDVAKKAASKGAEIAGTVGDTAKAAASGVGVTADALKDVGETIASNVKRNVRNFSEDSKENAATRKAVKAIGPDATAVYDEAGTPEFVNVVNNTKSVADLQAKSKMLDVAEGRIKGSASDELPRHVIADQYIAPRINTLQSRLGELGKTIGAAKEDTTSVDTTDIFNALRAEAAKHGVIAEPGVKVDAGGAVGDIPVGDEGGVTLSKIPGISGIDDARINTIKKAFEGFVPDEDGRTQNTIAQLAQSRKNLSDLTSRSDSAREVVAPGGVVDTARRLMAHKIGPAYYSATKDYSDIARTLEKLDPDLNVKLSEDSTKDITKVKLADYARRLLSNNASQAKSVFKSLDELYAKEIARKGGKAAEQNIQDLVDFAGSVEEGFGITPRNSFFGQIAGGIHNGLNAPSGRGVLDTVTRIMTKPVKNNKRAIEAMKQYIDNEIERRSKI